MNGTQGIRGNFGVFGTVGIIGGLGISSGGGGGGSLFNGTYWFSPLINNGNDTITDGAWINTNASSKTVELVSGTVTVPPNELATFPNHAVNRVNDDLLYNDNNCLTGSRNNGTTITNGINRQSDSRFIIIFDGPAGGDGKYSSRVTSDFIGSILIDDPDYEVVADTTDSRIQVSHPNNTEEELISLFGNDGTNANTYKITFPQSFPRDDLITLRESVGDTVTETVSVAGDRLFLGDITSCPTSNNFSDPAVLTWPGQNVEFSFNFTPLSDDPSEVYHIEWGNAAKDHYFGRNGVNYNFVHGNDTASFDTSLVNTNQTYSCKAIVTPSELIFELDGVEVARETRTDTQVAVWDSAAYLGGFQTTLAPLIVSQFRVKDYVATGNLTVVDSSAVTGDPNSSVYFEGSAGNLNPPLIFNGAQVNFVSGQFTSFNGDPDNFTCRIGFDSAVNVDFVATFNGQSFTFEAVNSLGTQPEVKVIYNETLYNLLLANRDTPIFFSIA